MASERPSKIIVLGAQRFDPSLRAAVDTLGVKGRIAMITAGWQEREPEDDELAEHLGGHVINLRLHARADEVFKEDHVFRDAHRDRQEALRHRQDFYRVRLEHALEAERVIRHRAVPAKILAEQAEESAWAIREIDEWHLRACGEIRAAFEEKWKPLTRKPIARNHEEIGALLAECALVAIAGGQVATLLNRLQLFDLATLIGERPIAAWCAGAMALSDAVVLFHDDPPQGPGATEVLDAGLGLLPGLVPLPQPEQRLHLDDRERVERMVRRFQPARCIALPARSWCVWNAGELESPHGVVELHEDGKTKTMGVRP